MISLRHRLGGNVLELYIKDGQAYIPDTIDLIENELHSLLNSILELEAIRLIEKGEHDEAGELIQNDSVSNKELDKSYNNFIEEFESFEKALERLDLTYEEFSSLLKIVKRKTREKSDK